MLLALLVKNVPNQFDVTSPSAAALRPLYRLSTEDNHLHFLGRDGCWAVAPLIKLLLLLGREI